MNPAPPVTKMCIRQRSRRGKMRARESSAERLRRAAGSPVFCSGKNGEEGLRANRGTNVLTLGKPGEMKREHSVLCPTKFLPPPQNPPTTRRKPKPSASRSRRKPRCRPPNVKPSASIFREKRPARQFRPPALLPRRKRPSSPAPEASRHRRQLPPRASLSFRRLRVRLPLPALRCRPRNHSAAHRLLRNRPA